MEEVLPATSPGWTTPRFSPNGQSLFATDARFEGIWQYNLATKQLRQLVADAGSGVAYSVSPDARTLVYRRTIAGSDGRTSEQEIVKMDLPDGTATVLSRARRLSAPAFAGGRIVSGEKSFPIAPALSKTSSAACVTGLENGRIALEVGGVKKVLDPMGNGHYIWPVLSPTGDRIVAYEMDHGAFVCDLNGTVIARLGRFDAPSWTRDGKWIVFMKEEDDGQKITGSDLYAVSPDGSRTLRLTETADVAEMYPDCSPTGDTIVCSTLDGRILLLTCEWGTN